jgi:Domain of unknown function (DUF4185)
MGAATYIGRVGGLAVALGVGTAIATGYGVASADETTSNPPSSDTSAASGTTETKTSTTTTSTQTSTEPSAAPEQHNSTTPSGTATNDVKGEAVVTAQTNTGTLGATGTTTEPTHSAEPTPEPTQTPSSEPSPTPEPTATPSPSPEPTATPSPSPEPTETPKTDETAAPRADTTPVLRQNSTGNDTASLKPTAGLDVSRSVSSITDTAVTSQTAGPGAVFADARALAAASPTMFSPMMAAQVSSADVSQPPAAGPQNPLTAVTKLVSNIIGFVLNPLAGSAPTTPAQPPLIWSLLAFARKEFDNFFAALAGDSTGTAASPLARLTTMALAAANLIPDRPRFPAPGDQLSPSTSFVDWVTGNYLPNNTYQRFSVWGTDVGTMWDNGIPDDPTTPENEHQVLIAVGDTFSGPNMTGDWINNTLFRSSSLDPVTGMAIVDGEWFNGNMFGGAPLAGPTKARPIIFKELLPAGLPTGVTFIPTAGISLPTPGTEFGATQYLSFMSVKQWGSPGTWTTNYSAIAYSVDNGENWKVAPTSIRMNSPYSGNRNFQQSAFVMGNDGYVYAYGTPNGRQGAAYVSRVLPKDILDVTKYEYYNKGTKSWFSSTPAGWYKNDPSKASIVFGKEGGACGVAGAGNTVSEMSVQYNKQLGKYVVLYGDQFNNIVMRTSVSPQGTWSTAKTILPQQNGGIYAPMVHPWSPSTMGTGTDLYWNLSLWSEYNVMLMRTDLTKV